MAESSVMRTKLWVKWKTPMPSRNAPRISRKFVLLGEECILRLSLDARPYPFNDFCTLALHKLIATEFFKKSFQVTTFIEDNRKDFKLVQKALKRVINPETTIWREDEKKMYECIRDLRDLRSLQELKIVCLFHVSQAWRDERSQGIQAHLGVPPNLERLSLDLSNLLEREVLPDVKLRCGDSTTSAHRCILAARSEVFAAMFRNKMAESETGIVDVTDMDAEVLDLFLKYMYSGKIPKLSDDTAQSLYAVGDMYAVHSLKQASSEWMVGGLTMENCLDFLILADAHSDEDFKAAVIDFVGSYMSVLGQSDSWLKFEEEHPRLALDVYNRPLTF